MDIASEVEKLMNGGYNKDAARAKVAHDIVLAAIRAAGFKDRVTIKGGVVMSGISKDVRRATMDADTEGVRENVYL